VVRSPVDSTAAVIGMIASTLIILDSSGAPLTTGDCEILKHSVLGDVSRPILYSLTEIFPERNPVLEFTSQ
jgi:hypothetical protein